MTLKNIRSPLLCCFMLCVSFGSHWWIQTGVRVRKHPIWVKIDNFFSCVTLKFEGWPWKTLVPSSKQNQALCIVSLPYVNSNWSYGPETAIWGHDLCDLDLWPFAWTSQLSILITPESYRIIRWQEQCQKGVTDRQTEISVLRAAWSQLKTA